MIGALDRKLLRDLWRIKGQALAIAAVAGCAVAMLVMSLGLLRSLEETRSAYYERYRFADVFAAVRRAPEPLRAGIARIPGVRVAESRIVADAMLDVAGNAAPVTGRFISLPPDDQPLLNRLVLRSGRLPAAGRPGEVVVGEAFAAANGLAPGGSVAALLNGRRQALTVVGTALSPEFVYAIGPGALMPDDRRFGTIWMAREPLAAAFDLKDAFNSLTLEVQHTALLPEVLAAVDRILAPYGGTGAIGRADQTSDYFLDNEIAQLRSLALISPPIFLGVAAFLLSVVVGRIIETEREQIGLLKAFGYTDLAVGWHYLKLVLLIVGVGVALGWIAGPMLGRYFTGLYTRFFHFPFLAYTPDLLSFGLGAVVTAGAAVAGTLGAVRRAAALPPAVAMAPAPPATYRAGLVLPGLARLDQPSRMVLRHVGRWPLRAGLTVAGIAMAAGLLIAATFSADSIDFTIDVQFFQANRHDATVTFAEPQPPAALDALRRLDGVLAAEPFRAVPVTLRNGHLARRIAVTAIDPEATLVRLLDGGQRPVAPAPEGLYLSVELARLLDLRAGDLATVAVMEGRRAVRRLPVAGLVEDYLGTNAWLAAPALPRLLGEGPRLSGAYLTLDGSRADALYRQLKDAPAVAGVQLMADALGMFRQTMAENVLTMTVINSVFAALIAIGVVYNSARTSLSERARDLATLRVLGFTRWEVAYILLGEMALLTLAALPLGCLVGFGFAAGIAALYASELYRIPLVILPATYAYAALVVLLAAAASGWLVQRRLGGLDLVAVLKTRD